MKHRRKVSVIISNRNDIVMLVVTIRSCIEALRPLGLDQCEIVVVDNSDPPAYEALKSAIPTGYCRDGLLKIYRQDFPCLFTAREKAAELSSSEYILCLDSHMLVGHNSIVELYNFMSEHSNDKTLAFAHAPLCWAHHHERTARHDRDMSECELGNWGKAYKEVRTITWKGMPWICRRDWFLDRDKGLNAYGALAQHRVSWGGGDMHIGIKPWLLGFKNWAVPTNPFIHIGPFPKIDLVGKDTKVANFQSRDRYRLYNSSGKYPHTFGFLVSCYVLGGEPMMRRNKKKLTEKFGKYLNIDNYWNLAKSLGKDEREWLLSRQKMSFEELLQRKPWNG